MGDFLPVLEVKPYSSGYLAMDAGIEHWEYLVTYPYTTSLGYWLPIVNLGK